MECESKAVPTLAQIARNIYQFKQRQAQVNMYLVT
jgi:hypothetical protein